MTKKSIQNTKPYVVCLASVLYHVSEVPAV